MHVTSSLHTESLRAREGSRMCPPLLGLLWLDETTDMVLLHLPPPFLPAQGLLAYQNHMALSHETGPPEGAHTLIPLFLL